MNRSLVRYLFVLTAGCGLSLDALTDDDPQGEPTVPGSSSGTAQGVGSSSGESTQPGSSSGSLASSSGAAASSSSGEPSNASSSSSGEPSNASSSSSGSSGTPNTCQPFDLAAGNFCNDPLINCDNASNNGDNNRIQFPNTKASGCDASGLKPGYVVVDQPLPESFDIEALFNFRPARSLAGFFLSAGGAPMGLDSSYCDDPPPGSLAVIVYYQNGWKLHITGSDDCSLPSQDDVDETPNSNTDVRVTIHYDGQKATASVVGVDGSDVEEIQALGGNAKLTVLGISSDSNDIRLDQLTRSCPEPE